MANPNRVALELSCKFAKVFAPKKQGGWTTIANLSMWAKDESNNKANLSIKVLTKEPIEVSETDTIAVRGGCQLGVNAYTAKDGSNVVKPELVIFADKCRVIGSEESEEAPF